VRRDGFTLLEIMLVVVLLALLAGAVTWSLAGQLRRSDRADVISRLEHADAMARVAARRHGPCVLRIDLDAQSLRRIDDRRGEGRASHTAVLPNDFGVKRVVTTTGRRDGTSSRRSGGAQQHTSGAVDIEYSRSGRSGAYALHVTGVRDDDEGLWLVFAGLTGQVTTLDNEDDVEKLFALLTTGRLDAD